MSRVRQASCAFVLIGVVATACGGRSGLDPAEGSETGGPAPGVAGSSATTGGSASGKPDPDPGKPDPGEPDPGMTDPDPGMTDPDPGTPDPTTPKPTPTPDANCTSDHAKGGMACSTPCVTTCGFYDLGTKGCDCVNGVFVSCHCPRPWDYQGAPTAPTCNTTDGRTHWIDNTPCTQEWAQCIGTDPVSGTNPRGCVCLTDPVNGKLEWTCGSTNKWFLHE